MTLTDRKSWVYFITLLLNLHFLFLISKDKLATTPLYLFLFYFFIFLFFFKNYLRQFLFCNIPLTLLGAARKIPDPTIFVPTFALAALEREPEYERPASGNSRPTLNASPPKIWTTSTRGEAMAATIITYESEQLFVWRDEMSATSSIRSNSLLYAKKL